MTITNNSGLTAEPFSAQWNTPLKAELLDTMRKKVYKQQETHDKYDGEKG